MSFEFCFRHQKGSFGFELEAKVDAEGITVIYGPSGSGKTSLLRFLAGLERAQKGHLAFDGSIWQDEKTYIPAHQRPCGYVFQEASLFPHLSVRGNLEFGYRKLPTHLRRIEWQEVVDLLGLDSLLEHFPHQLSGGQRQRVAIGRALLTSPQLLLMDEPLASLDGKAKREIIPYLIRLKERLSLPVFYVTHAWDELRMLADQLLLIDQGRVSGQGRFAQLISDPDSPLFSPDISTSLLMLRHSEGGFSLEGQPFKLRPSEPLILREGTVSAVNSVAELSENRYSRIAVTNRDLVLSVAKPEASTAENLFPVTVSEVLRLEDGQCWLKLCLGQQTLGLVVSESGYDALGLREQPKNSKKPLWLQINGYSAC